MRRFHSFESSEHSLTSFFAGHFAAKALEDPKKYAGRTIGLAGDDLTMSEVQDAYKAVQGYRPWKAYLPSLFSTWFLTTSGRCSRCVWLDFDSVVWHSLLTELFVQWLYEEGYKVDIEALKQEHAGLLSFEQWLRSE